MRVKRGKRVWRYLADGIAGEQRELCWGQPRMTRLLPNVEMCTPDRRKPVAVVECPKSVGDPSVSPL